MNRIDDGDDPTEQQLAFRTPATHTHAFCSNAVYFPSTRDEHSFAHILYVAAAASAAVDSPSCTEC